MKKILFFIMCWFSFLCMNKVNAVNITSEKIDGFYILDKESGKTYDFLIYKNEDEFLYSFNLLEKLPNNQYSTKYSIDMDEHLNMPETKWNKIKNLIYFGYGYEGHTDIKYYIITQLMIYEEIGINVQIGNADYSDIKTIFSSEFDEIIDLLTDFYLLPSYFYEDAINFNFDDEYMLVDKNDKEKEYDFAIETPGRIGTSNGRMYLYAKNPGQINLIAVKKAMDQTYNSVYYNDWITLANRAGLAVENHKVPVNIHGIGISIKNKDDEGFNVEGSIFELYNSKDEKIFTFVTDFNGEYPNKYFDLDNYYLIQKYVDDRYELIEEKISIDVNNFKTSKVVIVNEKIKTKVKLNLSYKYSIGESLFKESGATFGVYKDDELLYLNKTNEDGYLEFVLPLGEYTLNQIDSLMGFQLQSNIKLNLNSAEELELEFVNIKDESILKDENIDVNIEDIRKPENNINTEDEEIMVEEEIILDDEEYIIVDVPNTGINIRPFFLVIAIISLILSIIFYVKN